jgi:hypothetical protein
MKKMIVEEKQFTNTERMKFADKFLPILSGEEESIKSAIKTSRFSEDDPLEEYHASLPNGDVLGFIRNKTSLDFDYNFREQERTIDVYRKMALHPVVEQGLDQICDEAMNFSSDPDSQPIKLVLNTERLEKMGISEDTQSHIKDEYTNVLNLLDIREKGWDYFHQWYVDGRIYFELIFHEGEREIKEVKPISPYSIMKVKVKKKIGEDDKKAPKYTHNYFYIFDSTPEKEKLRKFQNGDYSSNDITDIDVVNYHQNGSDFYEKKNLKLIPEKYVICVESGIKSPGGFPISRLHFVRKYLNQLMLLQDAVVVYRISRAPERRAIYVDIPRHVRHTEIKQTMNDIAKEFKQKMIFDQRTGMVLDHRHVFATTEDFFIPRFDGNRTAEIDTLPGGENLGKMADVEYFLRETYRSMKVPLSRFFDDQALVSLGNDNTVARDEITFHKYTKRLRRQFGILIWKIFEIQLILKK